MRNMSTTYKKIIEYGLYFLVFLLPWQTRWIIRPGIINGGYSEFGTISLYGTDVVLAFLLFAAAAFFLLKRFQYPISNAQYPINDQLSIFKHKFFLFSIALFDLIIFISIFRSPDKLVALQKYFWFLLGVGLFWMVVSADYDRIKMLYAFLTGAVVQAILGIWQFLSQSSFACKWLGLASHDPAVPGTSVIETLSGERWLRAYGGLDHPNILGGYLVVGLLFLFMLLFKSSEANRPILDIRYRILGGNKNFLSDSGLRQYPISNIFISVPALVLVFSFFIRNILHLLKSGLGGIDLWDTGHVFICFNKKRSVDAEISIENCFSGRNNDFYIFQSVFRSCPDQAFPGYPPGDKIEYRTDRIPQIGPGNYQRQLALRRGSRKLYSVSA